jgi:hypothetical protein
MAAVALIAQPLNKTRRRFARSSARLLYQRDLE